MSTVSSSLILVPLIFSVISLIICIFSFIHLKSYLKQRTQIKAFRDKILSEIEDEVNKLILSIDEAAARDISIIEDRDKNLKTLLDEIDKRLGDYQKEIVKPVTAAPPDMPDSPPAEIPASFPIREFDVVAAAAAHQAEPAVLPAADEDAAETAAPPIDDQIRDLVFAGFSPQVIASRLGISVAQAEFAAALLERSR